MSLAHLLLAFLVVVIWGCNFVVIKIGLGSLPPLLFAALRFFFAAIPLVFFVKRPQVPFWRVAAYGLTQFALQFALLFGGMKLGVSAGLASIVIQVQAFFTIGLFVLVQGERPRRAQLLGGLVCLAGGVVVALNVESRATAIGLAMVVAAAVAWASANLMTRRMGRIDPLALVGYGSLAAAVPLFVLSALTEGDAAVAGLRHLADPTVMLTVFYQAYPNTLVGFGIWSMLVRRYPATQIAAFPLLVPVVGLIASALVLHEPLYAWKLFAGALILVGLALNQIPTRR